MSRKDPQEGSILSVENPLPREDEWRKEEKRPVMEVDALREAAGHCLRMKGWGIADRKVSMGRTAFLRSRQEL